MGPTCEQLHDARRRSPALLRQPRALAILTLIMLIAGVISEGVAGGLRACHALLAALPKWRS